MSVSQNPIFLKGYTVVYTGNSIGRFESPDLKGRIGTVESSSPEVTEVIFDGTSRTVHAFNLQLKRLDARAHTFTLQRDQDVSGVSGTGTVAEGIVFQDGSVALRWLTDTASTAVYASVKDVETIHGHGGATTIVWEKLQPVPGLSISEVVKTAAETSEANGFEKGSFAEACALIHSEVSEALEWDRNTEILRETKTERIVEELADVVIRVADTAGRRGYDLEGAIVKKLAKNKLRPFKHGKAY